MSRCLVLQRIKGVLRGWEKIYGRDAMLDAIKEWQDDRTYLTEERALDQRLDRKPEAA